MAARSTKNWGVRFDKSQLTYLDISLRENYLNLKNTYHPDVTDAMEHLDKMVMVKSIFSLLFPNGDINSQMHFMSTDL